MSRQGRNVRKIKASYLESHDATGAREIGISKCSTVCQDSYHNSQRTQGVTVQYQISSVIGHNTTCLFKDILQLWITSNSVHLKEATLYRYSYLIETHIMPELGELRMEELNSTLINAFLVKKLRNGRLDGQGGLSNSYVRSIMLVISSAMNFAFEQHLCPETLTPISKPPIQPKELPILDFEHQKELENALLRNIDETKLGIFISLYTGLRIGEICALSWEDIDLSKQVIHIRHTIVRIRSVENGLSTTKNIIDLPKTKSSLRCVPICSKLLPILGAFSNRASSRYVVSTNETFVSPRTFAYRYNKVLLDAGIPYINFHALRHTFATRCIETGVDVKSLSEILGHANVSITLNTYVHSSMALKRMQLEKMATSSV